MGGMGNLWMISRVWAGRRAKRFLASAICALAILTFALDRSTAASADASIIVHGNRRVDAAAIRGHFHAAPDGRLDTSAVNEGLKTLYASGLFEDVKIAWSGSRLIVTVVEAPVIDRVQFEGNKQLKDKDLAGEIRSRTHTPLTKAAIQDDVARLQAIYRSTGHYDVQITPKTIVKGEGRANLVFEIKEGPKTGIRKIVFIGNHAYSDQWLKGVIKTSESGWFAFLKTSDVYDPDRIESDRDLLRTFYLKNGYADVQIVAATGAYDPVQKGFIVTFTVDEGDRYRLGTIDIQSHIAAADASALRGELKLASGDVYDAQAVDKSIDALTAAMGKQGFPFVAVHPHAQRDRSAKLLNLVFALDEGPHAYIERIVIRGNTFTRDHVIRREFDIAEGDAYNRALVARAERRLKALGLFKSVKTSTEAGTTPDRVVLDVDIEEQQTGDFAVAGGYSTSYGFLAEVTVSERNFLGLGQYVKVSATLGQYVRGGKLSFAQPYFLDSRLTLGLDLFGNQVLTNPNQSYGNTVYGAGIRLAAPITDTISTEARYSLVNQSFSLNPVLMNCLPPHDCVAASAEVKQAVLNGPAWVSTIGSTFQYSTLDNPKNPHEGLRIEVKQDVAGLGGDVDFYKATDDVRYYHDFGNDLVGMARSQSGFVTPYGGQPLPFANGFFGGPQFVRGFAPNGFGPRDLTPGTTADNIGGSKYWATTAELQSSIPWLPPDFALKAAVFSDAGSMWGYRGQTSFPTLSQSLHVADTRQIRSSIGAGLIWDSPFGALRVDYAYPTSKAPYDITQRLHFGVGPF
jgi:outer membrane protein insertion porin family